MSARRSRVDIGVAFRFRFRLGGLRSTLVKGSIPASGGLPRPVQDRDRPCHRELPLTRIRRWKRICIAAACWASLWLAPGVSPTPGSDGTVAPATALEGYSGGSGIAYQSMSPESW